MMTNISILGSTGSIGRQSVAVAQRLGIRVSALAAFDNIGLLEEQALRLRPDLVAVYDAPAAAALHDRLSGAGIPVLSGMEGLLAASTAEGAQAVVTAVSGAVGAPPPPGGRK
jgi:1-deoxy-D-xylulose-5-phosphate reductoisomerase